MSVRFTRNDNLLRIILEGETTLDDLIAGVDEVYREAIPQFVLWDSSNTTVSEADDAGNQLRALSEYAVKKGKHRTNSRVALVSPANAQYGLGRLSTALAENNNAAYNMSVFRNEEEALAWLYAEDGDKS